MSQEGGGGPKSSSNTKPYSTCTILTPSAFQHKAMEEQHWGEYCCRNCMKLSERMRQRDVVIGALEQTRSREKIVRVVAYLREIQNGDMENLTGTTG
nr:hypothetical protein [Tanacetum cinerariifolium]